MTPWSSYVRDCEKGLGSNARVPSDMEDNYVDA
jgi:hypothetical protein